MANTAAYTLAYNKANPAKILLYAARQRAKRNGLAFNLTEKDICIPRNCPVFGIELIPQYGKGKQCDISPTLDRINPKLGYVVGNVIVISHLANRLKSDATPALLRRIADFYDTLCPSAPLAYPPIQPSAKTWDTLPV